MTEPVFRTIAINVRPAVEFDGHSQSWANPPIHFMAVIPMRRKQSWRRRLCNLFCGGSTARWVTTTDAEVGKLEAVLADQYGITP